MAMAARYERGLFDADAAPGKSLFDHTIWCFASDGDIEEGIASEASSIAGHQQLGNLVLLYDDNHISIEGDTKVALSEDVLKRYEAYGWHTLRVEDVNDVQALYRAMVAARDERNRPSIISVRSIIGWPAPNKQNTGKAHGSALGAEEIAATKKILGLDPTQSFILPKDVLAHAREVVGRGRDAHAAWQEQYDGWAAANPDGVALLERMQTRTLPSGWTDALPSFPSQSTRCTCQP
jgi:transketolase